MKKILCIALMMCLVSVIHAQSTSKNNKQNAKELANELKPYVEQFCYYVKKIGSTSDKITKDYKIMLCNDSVPTLFLEKYDERIMKTTFRDWNDGGKMKTRDRKMRVYFLNLELQSRKKETLKTETSVIYDLNFVFCCKNGELVWEKVHDNGNGTELERTKVYFYQTYQKITTNKNGDRDITHIIEEEDMKIMDAFRIHNKVTDTYKYRLGDITSVERLN